MEILDHLGDEITLDSDKNVYKRDWNWNPIDEAPVHLGYIHYWPDYMNVHYDEDVVENEEL